MLDPIFAVRRKRVPARLQAGLKGLTLGGRHGCDFLDLIFAPGLALVLCHAFQLLTRVEHEHGALLGLGLGVGLIAAVIGVLPSLLSAGGEIPYRSLAFTLAAVFLNGLIWTWVATRFALRGRLVDALRNK